MMISIPDNRIPKNQIFFVITQLAYAFGLTAHIFLGLLFYKLDVILMAGFNLFLSVPIFSITLVLNRRGFQNTAFSFAIFELYFHQVTGVYVLGWESGLQYYLIYLAVLPFFNAAWGGRLRFFFICFISATYALLYISFRTPDSIQISAVYYHYLYLFNTISTLVVLAVFVNYFVQSAYRSEKGLKQANAKLSKKNRQIAINLEERNTALAALNKELSEAAEYVKTILPKPMRRSSVRIDWRFIPSVSLGGDAFGYHWLNSNRLAVYLIDVSGHGVRAALLSVSIINALRCQSLPGTDFHSPAIVLNVLNKTFQGEQNNALFFSIWYGVYDTDTRQMCYATGGHPPAFLKHPDKNGTHKIKSLRTPNLVIGAMPDVHYTESVCTIPENSILYIFSDGVYEIMKTDGQMWRLNGLKEYIGSKDNGPDRVLDQLIEYAQKLGGKEEFADDFTILEIEFS